MLYNLLSNITKNTFTIKKCQYRGDEVCRKFSANCFFNTRIISSFFVFSSISFCIDDYNASFSYHNLEYSSFIFVRSVVFSNASMIDSLDIWLTRTDLLPVSSFLSLLLGVSIPWL